MRKRKAESPASEFANSETAILLDTHVAVWLSNGTDFKSTARVRLEKAYEEGMLCISAISAWEIGMLVSKSRLDLGLEPLAWFDRFIKAFNVAVIDLTPEIAIKSSFLSGKVHADPADRILIATALVNSMAIASADSAVSSCATNNRVQLVTC